MSYYSNEEIYNKNKDYVPAKILNNGRVIGPQCCGKPMLDNGDCGMGCCDDYKCSICGYKVRIEWPD